jgi:hypothetical protein
LIGIYQDEFVDYLEDKLSTKVKTTSKNLIIPCPWCEFGKQKDHYHMYISLEAPIFHCFHANCEKSGTLRKILSVLEGHDISDQFVDKDTLKKLTHNKTIFVDKDTSLKEIQLPILNTKMFPYKEMYINKRLRFANIPVSQIKGLIFDVYEFISINNIPVDETLFRLRDYLHNNFVGFLTENGTTAVFRNIDHTHNMRYYKLKIQHSSFIDYYKLRGNNPKSKKIVLAEGIFDIFSEHIFDNLNIKNEVKLYASVLSSKFSTLLKSIIYYEQVFKPDVIILSDRGIPIWQYKNLKKKYNYLMNTLKVYYNKSGKDFGDGKVSPITVM